MAYMPQYNPYAYPQIQYPQTAPQKMEVTRVNGRGGAEAFVLAPNSSVVLLDESAPIIWLKTTDGAGYPTLTPYDIAPHKEPEAINTQNIQSLEERISRLESIVNESNVSEASRSTGTPGKRSPNKADVQSA